MGPGKVSVIVEALTDNRARTAPVLRSLFSKSGGALGETGSVTFNFERIGYIEYPVAVGTPDAIFEAALDAGADDVVSTDETHEITCQVDDLGSVRDALEAKLGTPNVARRDWKPMVQKEITDLETAQKLMKFLDVLNEDDDVQRVITNADISEEIMAQLGE